MRAPVLPFPQNFLNPLQDARFACKEAGIFFLKIAQTLYRQCFGAMMESCNRVKQGDASCLEIVGKKRLCERLGWARTRLDRRLARDPLFPVFQRGIRRQPWRFDIGVVLAYLERADAKGATQNTAALGTPQQQLHAIDLLSRSKVYLKLVQATLDDLERALFAPGDVRRGSHHD